MESSVTKMRSFFWHYLHHRRSLKAGEYLFDKSRNIVEVHKRLVRGDVYFRTVVVPEGFTMFDIARAIEGAGLGSSGGFPEGRAIGY